MKEVKLKVSDENLDTLLTILENLKAGLITNIEVDGKKSRPTQYQPKHNRVIKEEESGTHDTTGKYLNPAAYKQRLKK